MVGWLAPWMDGRWVGWLVSWLFVCLFVCLFAGLFLFTICFFFFGVEVYCLLIVSWFLHSFDTPTGCLFSSLPFPRVCDSSFDSLIILSLGQVWFSRRQPSLPMFCFLSTGCGSAGAPSFKTKKQYAEDCLRHPKTARYSTCWFSFDLATGYYTPLRPNLGRGDPAIAVMA